jgi:hypothetical protein
MSKFSTDHRDRFVSDVDHLWMGLEEVEQYREAENYWLDRLQSHAIPSMKKFAALRTPSDATVIKAMAQWLTFRPYRKRPSFQSAIKQYNGLLPRRLLDTLVPLAGKLLECAPKRSVSDQLFEDAVKGYMNPNPLVTRLVSRLAASGSTSG